MLRLRCPRDGATPPAHRDHIFAFPRTSSGVLPMAHRSVWAADQGGGSGIRTHEPLAGLAVFKTATFGRSAIPPGRSVDDGSSGTGQTTESRQVRTRSESLLAIPVRI